MPVVSLTPAFMNASLKCPQGMKRIEYCDSEVPGLLIECRVAQSAVPTWYLRHKVSGKTAYRRLGSVKELGLAQARKQAKAAKAELALAAKSADIAAVAKSEMTLDVFMCDHYFPHARMHKRSHKKDDQLYRIRTAPRFGHLALSAITRHEVQVFQNDLLNSGMSPASADHHVKLLRRVLNLAVQWEFLEKNPLKGIKLFMVDNQVENYLDPEQLERLINLLRTDPNRTVCLILMFLLSTGARLNEALTASWKNVNIDSGVWKVDAALSKSKRSRSIPLNDSALWVIEQLDTRDSSELLFPSPVTGKPYSAITRAWYRLRRDAGIPKVRIHDLRHSFASMLVSGGRTLYEVQQILGHSDPKVTMRYAHLSSKTLQEAANAASMIVKRPAPALA